MIIDKTRYVIFYVQIPYIFRKILKSVKNSKKFFIHSTPSLVGTQASEIMPSTHAGNSALFTKIVEGTSTEGVVTIQINSSTYRASYNTVGNFGMVIIAAKNEAILTAAITQQTTTSVIIAVVVCIVVAVISFVVARIITNPIIKLKESANKIAAGEYILPERFGSNDEIGLI